MRKEGNEFVNIGEWYDTELKICNTEEGCLTIQQYKITQYCE